MADKTPYSNPSAPYDCAEDRDVHENRERSHHWKHHCRHKKSQFDLVDWRKELKRFEEFGLGRGVDASDPSPFANKTAFHVIPIDSEDSDMILCTDEGGAFHSIFQSLETSDKATIQLTAAVPLPQTPIQIGAAVEYSRSTMRRGYTIGKKVITRSVEFRMGHHLNQKGTSERENYFETWIKQQCSDLDRNVKKLVELITQWRITHYISKIQLGAAEYCTMSEMYYNSLAKGKAGLGVDKIAELALSASKKHTSSSHVSEMKRIGFMSDEGVVERGNYQEAVLDVQLTSIATLITKDKDLRDNLTNALCFYIAARSYGQIGYKHQTDLLSGWLCESSSVEDAITNIRKMERPPNRTYIAWHTLYITDTFSRNNYSQLVSQTH